MAKEREAEMRLSYSEGGVDDSAYDSSEFAADYHIVFNGTPKKVLKESGDLLHHLKGERKKDGE